MLDLLLSIPKDVVRGNVISFLDLASLAKLDAAAKSHIHRRFVLSHILADVEMQESVEYTGEILR